MLRSATPGLTALLGGALLAAAFAIEPAWPAVFLAVAGFVLSLEWSESRPRALSHAALFGWAAYVGGFHWIQPTLALFWEGRVVLSWMVWLLWGAVVTLRFVAIGWIYRALRQRNVGIFGSLLLPWLTVEWLYPSLFPFYLANPLVDQSLLVQAAALGGPLLVSAWVCGVSAIIAEGALWLAQRRPIARTHWSAVVVATLALLLHGWHSVGTLEQRLTAAPTVTVGVVQANVDVMQKRTERRLVHRHYAERSRALETRAKVDLLVWPETSYLRALPVELPTTGGEVRGDLRAPLLFGGIRVQTDRGRRERFNSAMLVEPDGMIRSAYDKRFLIPFAEFIPLGDRIEWWSQAAPTLSRFRPGERFASLRFGQWRIATPICYETIRPEYVRRLVGASGAHLLVSLTNDGWFGDSAEPRLHLALARFRAIEHRRYLVRATNTGISAIVDPAGRIVAQSGLFEPATLIHPVHMLDETTIYAALGDWPGYVAATVLLWVYVRRRRQGTR